MSGDGEINIPAQLDIRRVAGRIGAEIRGVRLSGDLAETAVQSICDALHTHKVIFFRDQSHLDDATQEAFATRMGEPVPHPTARIASGSKYLMELSDGGGGNVWHTDVTFTRDYPKASILRQLVAPEYGGDTIWANGAEAYQRLPESLRVLADGLWVVHSNGGPRAARFGRTPIEAEHPVVQVHPVTGERVLVLGIFARTLVGFPDSESRRLIDLLQGYMTRPENTVRWNWRVGDVAIWDNRATMHYAVYDYGDQHRVMRRVTLVGNTPVSVDGRQSRSIEAVSPALPQLADAAMA